MPLTEMTTLREASLVGEEEQDSFECPKLKMPVGYQVRRSSQQLDGGIWSMEKVPADDINLVIVNFR